MPTLRFGTPGPSSAEQVALRTRWGSRTVPAAGEWETVFPYAMGITATAHAATFRVIGGTGTESFELNSTDRIQTALYHQDSGIVRNGLDSVAFFNAHSTFEGWADVLDGTPIRLIQGIHQDLEDEWMPLSDGAASQAVLDAILVPALDLYDDHPSVIAYVFEDDLSANATTANRAEEVMLRVPQLDAAARPASPAILSGDTLLDPAAMGSMLVFGPSHYAVRWASTGVRKTEGDFTITGGTDWQSYPRAWVLDYPDAHIWWWLQAHQLGDGSDVANDLAYPTAREIRKMVWEAVGSGVKGILWFIFNDMPELPSLGQANPSSRERYDAVAEMGKRLSPSIRQRLLRCAPSAANTEFTASGGGSGSTWLHANFANAYISTLHDASSDTYYVVVCNRSLSTASVTIDSATLSGNLVNLETGATIAVGSSVSLGPLDGTIFRFVSSDQIGVPHVMPVATMSTEEWWDSIWFNPASNNYVAYGDILTHANQVTVAPGNLQAALDAEPDDTTFLLESGVHTSVSTTARQGTHIIPANPATRPTMRSFNYFGHAEAAAGRPAFVAAVVTNNEPSAVAAYLDPPGDVLIRDIDFVAEPGVLSSFADASTDHLLNFPIVFWAIADWCVEGCTFSGYKCVDANGLDVGSIIHHHGYINAIAGVHNGVMRNCTMTPTMRPNGTTRAWATGVYYDGAAGCGFVYNTMLSNPFHYGPCVILTNDDYAPNSDTAYDGAAGYDEINGEIPQSRYTAVVGNTGANAGHLFVSYSGRNLLHAENTCAVNAAVQVVLNLEPKASSHSPGMNYLNYDNVSRDNVYTNGSNNGVYVRHTYATGVYADGSRVGRTTISNNSFPDGAVTAWHGQTGTGTVEPPITATNNTDSNGTRDGV